MSATKNRVLVGTFNSARYGAGCKLYAARYARGGALALTATAMNWEFGVHDAFEEPLATLTVSYPGVELRDGEALLRYYDEARPIIDEVRAAGLFAAGIRLQQLPDGMTLPVVRLADEAPLQRLVSRDDVLVFIPDELVEEHEGAQTSAPRA